MPATQAEPIAETEKSGSPDAKETSVHQEVKDTSQDAEEKKELGEDEPREELEMETKELVSNGHPLVLLSFKPSSP